MSRKVMTPQEFLARYKNGEQDFTCLDFSEQNFWTIKHEWNDIYRKNRHVDVSHSTFEGASLPHLYLSGSIDVCTVYDHAKLRRIRKIGSDHRGASFVGADLYEAHLDDSDNTPYVDTKTGETKPTDFSGIKGYGIWWFNANCEGMKMHSVSPEFIRLMRFTLHKLSPELKRRILGTDLSSLPEKQRQYARQHGLYPAGHTSGPFERWGENIWKRFKEHDKVKYSNGYVDELTTEVMKELGIDYSP